MSLTISPRSSYRFLTYLRIFGRFSSSSNASFWSGPKENPIMVKTQYSNAISFDTKLFLPDIYDHNVNISCLGRCGKVKEARKLFDEMRQRDIVSYTSMITVYLKNGDLPNAEKLFQEMPERNVVVDSAMIGGYAKSGRIEEARQIFDEMPKRNVFSWTSLISGYSKIGRINEARHLFDRMPERNTVSWTTMVLGYARNGMIADARHLFDRMPDKNVISWTAMIKAYVEEGQTESARKLFDEMPQRNLYSWNIMISAYLDDNRVGEAIKLFELMPQRNVVSWTTIVTGLARNGSIENARKFFDRMPEKDIAAWNAMITAYADEGYVTEASELFTSMPKRNIVTWNAIIDGYTKNGLGCKAQMQLVHMLRTCERPNETTFTTILTACEILKEVTQVHSLVILFGFDTNTLLANALVTMYSRGGDVGSAQLAFEKLVARDIVSWTAMILAYSNHGCGHHALGLFARMIRVGAKPDRITFVGVLSACSHAGLVEKGKRAFASMSRAYGLEPKAEHYSCLVDLLGRAGCVDEAKRVVNQMPCGERDAAVLAALLGACKLHGDVGVASQAGEELIKLEPNGSGGYVLLANVYATRGKWDDVARVRKKMKERKVIKVPGFSQIEVKNRNHVFFVGDRRHPQVKEIYEMLEEELLPQMKDMGYSQRN
ncbi:uncharacterized protein LOC143856539 [Tasmannia lanceolata]|uniref:uncharacterized protein LOC143856539 n=1 Tax=Tasmannia lanceolata TaxID=3420 RepID=UPI004063E721